MLTHESSSCRRSSGRPDRSRGDRRSSGRPDQSRGDRRRGAARFVRMPCPYAGRPTDAVFTAQTADAT
eukprot:2906358-Prymnesium_polylepis.1